MTRPPAIRPARPLAAAALALLVAGAPARGEDIDQTRLTAALRTCYDAAQDVEAKQACIGTASAACQAEEEGGYTTLGISMCNHAESQAWDLFLNEEYRATMAASKAMDADEAEYFPNLDKRAETLREAQRAWIAFRDAECIDAYAQWGSGSMRHIAGTACLLDMTAERTIALWGKRLLY